MMARCRSSLAPLEEDGYTARARRALAAGKTAFPHRLSFTRAELNLQRLEGLPRMSISGVQDKVQLKLERGRLHPVAAGGDFLLKPIPSTPIPHAEDVPANEHLCMQIAGQVFAIETPPNALVSLADGEPAYLVRRYDRAAPTVDGKVHQEDLGQVMGRSTESRNWKYEGSYEEMAVGIRRACPAAAIALERLWRRIVFCYAIGNGDAHWKNFSVLEDSLGGYVLAPAYDLVATTLHFPNEPPLALDLLLDGELTPSFKELGFWTGGDFLELARRWGLHPRRCQNWLLQFPLSSPSVLALVEASFLSLARKDQLAAFWVDRVRALEMASIPA